MPSLKQQTDVLHLFNRYSDFFLAPFDVYRKNPRSDKRTFQRWLSSYRETNPAMALKFHLLNYQLTSLLEHEQSTDDYHQALTGKPNLSEEAVIQQDALSEDKLYLLMYFLAKHESFVLFMFDNRAVLETLSLAYNSHLQNLDNKLKRKRKKEPEDKSIGKENTPPSSPKKQKVDTPLRAHSVLRELNAKFRSDVITVKVVERVRIKRPSVVTDALSSVQLYTGGTSTRVGLFAKTNVRFGKGAIIAEVTESAKVKTPSAAALEDDFLLCPSHETLDW